MSVFFPFPYRHELARTLRILANPQQLWINLLFFFPSFCRRGDGREGFDEATIDSRGKSICEEEVSRGLLPPRRGGGLTKTMTSYSSSFFKNYTESVYSAESFNNNILFIEFSIKDTR